MTYLSAAQNSSSDGTMAFFVIAAIVVFTIAAVVFVQLRRTAVTAGQQDDLRQLVRRYEQLAEGTLDAQQRVVADVSELRTRTTSIEQLLRTVD